MADENLMHLARKIAMEKLHDTIEAKVNDEYRTLCYQSELVEADEPMMDEIEKLYHDSFSVRPKGFMDAMGIGLIRQTIKGFLDTGMYHPMELKRFRYTIVERLSRA